MNHKKNDRFIKAWKNGNTGYPLIDACMRALKETGWINFRSIFERFGKKDYRRFKSVFSSLKGPLTPKESL